MQSMTDTAPEIAAIIHTRMMALTGAQRMRMGSEMFDAARMVIASMPADVSPEDFMRASYQRIYGEPLTKEPTNG